MNFLLSYLLINLKYPSRGKAFFISWHVFPLFWNFSIPILCQTTKPSKPLMQACRHILAPNITSVLCILMAVTAFLCISTKAHKRQDCLFHLIASSSLRRWDDIILFLPHNIFFFFYWVFCLVFLSVRYLRDQNILPLHKLTSSYTPISRLNLIFASMLAILSSDSAFLQVFLFKG